MERGNENEDCVKRYGEKKEDKSMLFYAQKYKEILLIRFTYTK